MKKIIVIGHSHIRALRHAWSFMQVHNSSDVLDFDFHFINLYDKKFIGKRFHSDAGSVGVESSTVDKMSLSKEISDINPDILIVNTNGNRHNIFGFSKSSDSSILKINRLKKKVYEEFAGWLGVISSIFSGDIIVVPPPPPVEDNEKIFNFLSKSSILDGRSIGIELPEIRLNFWQQQCEVIKKVSIERRLKFFGLPVSVFGVNGFLANDCCGDDVTHANLNYGKKIILEILKNIKRELMSKEIVSERYHPYVNLPNYCFWKQAVGAVLTAEVDPVVQTRFKIQPKHRVATAGSCFAQHISKRLRNSGFNFFVTEKPDETDAEGQTRGFYDFSARYGNIYTSRQLLQLFDRAFGYYKPNEQFWSRHGGGYCDPFRPLIEPEGFTSPEAVVQDGRRHLAAVRRMFKNLDIFVFTLGLTECWVSRLDGAAYPLAPGVAGGAYDPEKYVFVNLGAGEVVADLKLFLQKLKLVNPKARMVLTVSPVPLMATAERDMHVLVATTYSKSVLRVAAQEIVNSHDNVYYFPSYEIITGQHVGNGYYADDRRGVVEQGVDHVMRIFMSHLTESGQKKTPESSARTLLSHDDAAALAEVERLVQVACDEEMLAK